MSSFSIITICFNSENEIRKTIESVLTQSYDGRVEYLIIDGGSKDKTVEIARQYESEFKNKGYEYEISSEPDNGIYDAMNKGISKASGELIGIINAGDLYKENTLAVVAETYESDEFDIFYADINLVKPNGKVLVKHSRYDRIVTSRHWNHPTTFVTKATYEELGSFKCIGIHDDFEFILRSRKAGKRIVIRNVVLADFMIGGISNTKDIKRAFSRIKDRYTAYRINGYSPLYIVECVGIEMAKFLMS